MPHHRGYCNIIAKSKGSAPFRQFPTVQFTNWRWFSSYRGVKSKNSQEWRLQMGSPGSKLGGFPRKPHGSWFEVQVEWYSLMLIICCDSEIFWKNGIYWFWPSADSLKSGKQDSCSFQICNVPLSNETSGKFYTESLMEKSCGIYGIHLGIVMVSNVTLGVENCRLKRRGGFDQHRTCKMKL